MKRKKKEFQSCPPIFSKEKSSFDPLLTFTTDDYQRGGKWPAGISTRRLDFLFLVTFSYLFFFDDYYHSMIISHLS